jgi:hypothetical protein
MAHTILDLPYEIRRELEQRLDPGERVAYAGLPDWRAGWGSLATITLFGAGWSAITLFLTAQLVKSALGLAPFHINGAPASRWGTIPFLLFMIPFLAIGLGCLAAPLLAAINRGRTVHAVTDRRLLTLRTGRWQRVESHMLSTVNSTRVRLGRDGRGSLTIGYGVTRDSDGDPKPLTLHWAGIPDAAAADAAIRSKQPPN